jgi:ribosomal-protein-alanine N-acetyltransferase
MSTARQELGEAVTLAVAAPSDAVRLAVLHAHCFDDPWQAELIARVLGSPGGFGFVARRADRIIGFVLCRSTAGEGEILTLCVDVAARRRGLGRELLSKAMAEAGRRGLASLFLEVAENNAGARRLYVSFGFEPVGRRSAYYRSSSGAVDALTLRRGLGSDLD